MESIPDLPIPISVVQGKYLLFDIDAITWLRRKHQVVGAFIGSLPQSPSQNVFLGLPVQIIPEEAQLLVDKGVGFIVEDARAHDEASRNPDSTRASEYLANLRKHAGQITRMRVEQKEKEKKLKMKLNADKRKAAANSNPDVPALTSTEQDADHIFEPAPVSSASSDIITNSCVAGGVSAEHAITPTTSSGLLPTSSPTTAGSDPVSVRNLPVGYPLYRHLNSKGYFMTPGLRFGCNYSVYPGDPLRFHAHFLAIGVGWDEQLDLMDIVSGGRLGTGVKKGYLMGGESPDGVTKTFSIEWAAM